VHTHAVYVGGLLNMLEWSLTMLQPGELRGPSHVVTHLMFDLTELCLNVTVERYSVLL